MNFQTFKYFITWPRYTKLFQVVPIFKLLSIVVNLLNKIYSKRQEFLRKIFISKPNNSEINISFPTTYFYNLFQIPHRIRNINIRREHPMNEEMTIRKNMVLCRSLNGNVRYFPRWQVFIILIGLRSQVPLSIQGWHDRNFQKGLVPTFYLKKNGTKEYFEPRWQPKMNSFLILNVINMRLISLNSEVNFVILKFEWYYFLHILFFIVKVPCIE